MLILGINIILWKCREHLSSTTHWEAGDGWKFSTGDVSLIRRQIISQRLVAICSQLLCNASYCNYEKKKGRHGALQKRGSQSRRALQECIMGYVLWYH